MASKDIQFLANIVEKVKKALGMKPRNREEFIEQTADELVERFRAGQIEPEELEKWTDRLSVEETKLVADLVYSQLVIRATFHTRMFDEAIIEGGSGGRNAGYIGVTSGVTMMEESLTDFFLPRFLENWTESIDLPGIVLEDESPIEFIIRSFEAAEKVASVYLSDKKKELVVKEKNRFEEQLELIEEISELARSFEDEDLAEEREEIYELDRNIRTRLESSTPAGMMEGFGGPRSVPADEQSKSMIKRRNELLQKRKERTPDEIREKIHQKYEKLNALVEDSEDIKEDVNILEKEEIL